MIEVRRMRATDDEMKCLVANLMAGRSTGPDGADNKFTVTGLTFDNEGPLKIRVTGRFKDGRPHQFTLTASLIIAAFVVFCNEQGVPMSRQSVKSVVKTR
ncbi:MAG TPA: hypothetical protein ENI69_07370, partial [Rhodospirillales bacterium]|nr:hypothetical protein [Rhodospirillales bacterium]